MSKIYLDCTHTYNSGLNTGIQRVVKNIVKNIPSISLELDESIIPITTQNATYLKFDEFPKINIKNTNLKTILKNIYIKVRKISSYLLPKKLHDIFYSPRLNIFLSTTLDKLFFAKKLDKHNEIILNDGDTLILMDAIWLHNDYEKLKQLKKNNIKIIAIIYDIIPLSHPQFCSIDLTNFLKDWYKNSTEYISGFISISKTVQEDIYNYLKNNIDVNIEHKKFDYFYLGAKFSENIPTTSSHISKEYQQIFQTQDVYLSVSTIEPRKNHSYILDSFSKLWTNNINAKCVFIGKIGWDVQELITKIKSHEEYNKRLFLLTEVDDDELVYAYKNSKALIFASYIEGFGLPIIESLHYSLPVIISDIKIHREIAKDKATYFNLSDSNSLFSIIKSKKIKRVSNFTWQSWSDSTKELIIKSRSL